MLLQHTTQWPKINSRPQTLCSNCSCFENTSHLLTLESLLRITPGTFHITAKISGCPMQTGPSTVPCSGAFLDAKADLLAKNQKVKKCNATAALNKCTCRLTLECSGRTFALKLCCDFSSTGFERSQRRELAHRSGYRHVAADGSSPHVEHVVRCPSTRSAQEDSLFDFADSDQKIGNVQRNSGSTCPRRPNQ